MSALTVKSEHRTYRKATSAVPVLLALPSIVALLVLILIPTASVIVVAFTDWQFGALDFDFIGVRNFVEVWNDHAFWQAAANTLVYSAIVIPGTIALGLAVALLINSRPGWGRFYEALHFLPVMATMAAMAIVWEAMLHPTIGLVNQILARFGLHGANWLRDPATVLPTLAVIGIWQQFGFAMVLFLAGLRSIPEELYSAAKVDGAGAPLDRFLTVTFPMLGPTSLFIAVITAIRSLQVFDTVQVLTQGGPDGASEVLLHRLYTESFQFLRTGYGSAFTVVFMVAVVILTLIQNNVLERKVHYS
jgi:multiple sugar transport system permease protein